MTGEPPASALSRQSIVARLPNCPPDDYALAVGTLCNEWARLESAIGYLFMAIAGWSPLNAGAVSMAKCFSARDHLAAIRVGSVFASRNAQWVELTIMAADYVENQIRPQRNRYVHDTWVPTGDGDAILYNPAPKLSARHPSGSRAVQEGSIQRIHFDQINALISDILDHHQYFMALRSSVHAEADWTLPAMLTELPARPLLHVQKETQRQQAQSIAKPPRQRKPSAASRRAPKEAQP